MAFKSKADLAFDKKMKVLMDEALEFGWNERTSQNVERLFHLYGCYLELVEPLPVDTSAPPATGKELVYVQPDEPTPAEEQEHVLSGAFAAFCVQTLHVDPVTMKKLTAAELEAHGVMDHDR